MHSSFQTQKLAMKRIYMYSTFLSMCYQKKPHIIQVFFAGWTPNRACVFVLCITQISLTLEPVLQPLPMTATIFITTLRAIHPSVPF